MEPTPNPDEQQRVDSPDDSDRPRIKTQLYKTEPCQNWSLYGTCGYGRMCKFAHGTCEQRTRPRHPKYRTSMCTDFPLGTCAFGNRCNFAHTPDELRSPIPTVPTAAAHSVNNRPSVAASKKQSAGVNSSKVPAIARVAGDIRRYQSMGTLRSARPVIKSSALPTHPVPALPSHELGVSGLHSASIDTGSIAAYQVYAHPPSEHPGITHAQHYPDMAKQPLHYLQHEQVARRVSSLSQLPNLRASSSFSSPAIITAPSNGYFQQSFQAAASSQSASYHASPLAQMPPVGAVSPAISLSSCWESDDASALPLHADGNLLATEYLRLQQTQHYFAPTLPSSSNSFPNVHPQGHTLTSSLSMQTLPRLQASAGWEQHRHSPQSGNTLLSSSFPALKSISSSQGSAATLIDSELWSSTAQFKSFSNEQQPVKPYESRFFPPPSAGTAATLETADAASLVLTSGADPFGIYHNGAYIPSNNQQQQQLRRQHSTGDWISLRNAAHQQASATHKLLPAPTNFGSLLEPSDDRGMYVMMDNHFDSLETAGAVNSGLVSGADPFGIYHNGAYIPSNNQHQQQLRRQHSTGDWISLRNAAHQQASATHKLLPSSTNFGPLLEPSDDRGTYATMDNRFNSLEQLRTATSTRRQLSTYSAEGL
ncbi:hypothetical protein GGI17_002259 [Coemansia sp. S146]|nr:hypothetical protein GGI17_002259 [Coemansia sp. S146]